MRTGGPADAPEQNSSIANGKRTLRLILAWSFVGIPLLWGVLQTLRNALKLFRCARGAAAALGQRNSPNFPAPAMLADTRESSSQST